MTEVIKLDIPYRSQWDADATSHSADCGPTCLAMLLNAHGTQITPDQLYKFIPPKTRQQFVSMSELMRAGKKNQLSFEYKQYMDRYDAMNQLLQLVDNGFAPIALVKYEPWQPFTGNQFSWGHFVVVTGYSDQHIFLHDPLFGMWKQRSRGNHLQMERSLFMRGWGGFPPTENPNYAVLIPKKSVFALVAPPPPAPVAPPPPVAPAPQPTTELTPSVARRIRALAGYLRTSPPNLDNPDEAAFWLKYIGDWGKETAVHRIRPNDTLGVLAFRFYNESGRWQAIQAYNNLSNDRVWVGQQLEIPLHDAAESHLNPTLRQSISVMEGAALEPIVVDYDLIGANTIGIGFIDETEIESILETP